MSFLYAISGWQWLLAAAVPAGIIALYFLKLKRKPLEVPSTFLWKRSVEDLHVNSLLQRLRRNLLLFLQLLTAALVILALLRPVTDTTEVGRHMILVIDNSASMSAQDVAPTRLEVAKQKALDLVQRMKPSDAAMVIASNDAASVGCSYTKNAAEIKRAISSIAQTNRRTNLREALTIASGLANPQQTGGADEGYAQPIPADLYLFSDGRIAETTDVPLGNLELKYVAIGSSRNNVSLVTLAARRNDENPQRLDVLARVRNYTGEALSITAELTVDGRSTAFQKVDFEAGSDHVGDDQAMTFRLNNIQETATIGVALEVDDHLSLDDVGWTVVNPPHLVRVLVVGEENVVLKSVLSTTPLQSLASFDYMPSSFAAQELEGNAKAEAYDLIIFDRCSPPSMPSCNTFLIGALPPELASVAREDVQDPIILTWNSSHPALRFLFLDDVNVLKAFIVTPPRGADALIESDRGPLLFTVPRDLYTDLVQSFPLVDDEGNWQTDWPLKTSFPLYAMNVIRGLAGAGAEALSSYQPGATVTLRTDSLADAAEIELPDGQRVSRRFRQGKLDFLDTDQIGVYQVRIGDQTRRFAVNLFDDEESNIMPAESVNVGEVSASSRDAEIASRREFWRPLALLAFILLLLEWYIYNRRVYI